jgi:hypothetical protein
MAEIFMTWLSGMPSLGVFFQRLGIGGNFEGLQWFGFFLIVSAVVWLVCWRLLLFLFTYTTAVTRVLLFLLALFMGCSAGAAIALGMRHLSAT